MGWPFSARWKNFVANATRIAAADLNEIQDQIIALNSAAMGYGSGVDGSQTLDGAATILGMVPAGNVYTATRDLNLQDLTINTGVTLVMAGFRLYVAGTLTLAGTANLNFDGAAGSSFTGGAGVAGIFATAGGATGGIAATAWVRSEEGERRSENQGGGMPAALLRAARPQSFQFCPLFACARFHALRSACVPRIGDLGNATLSLSALAALALFRGAGMVSKG